MPRALEARDGDCLRARSSAGLATQWLNSSRTLRNSLAWLATPRSTKRASPICSNGRGAGGGGRSTSCNGWISVRRRWSWHVDLSEMLGLGGLGHLRGGQVDGPRHHHVGCENAPERSGSRTRRRTTADRLREGTMEPRSSLRRIGSESGPPNLAVETNLGGGAFLAPKPSSPVRLGECGTRKTPRNRGNFPVYI